MLLVVTWNKALWPECQFSKNWVASMLDIKSMTTVSGEKMVSKYTASRLGRPLVVISFLYRLYLPKFAYVVRTYFHARSNKAQPEIFAQGCWWHFANTNSYLMAISCDITDIMLSNHDGSWLAQQQMTRAFRESLADQICRWAHEISRLESYFSCKTAKHLCRWSAQQKGCTGLQQY